MPYHNQSTQHTEHICLAQLQPAMGAACSKKSAVCLNSHCCSMTPVSHRLNRKRILTSRILRHATAHTLVWHSQAKLIKPVPRSNSSSPGHITTTMLPPPPPPPPTPSKRQPHNQPFANTCINKAKSRFGHLTCLAWFNAAVYAPSAYAVQWAVTSYIDMVTELNRSS